MILLEWLMASALGIFLLLLLGQMFQDSTVSHSLRRAQSDAIAALLISERLIVSHLHLGTALPCGSTPEQVNLVNGGNSLYWLDLFARPRQIHAYDSAAAAAIHPLGSGSGGRAAGSDVLVVLTARQPVRVVAHDVMSGTFALSAASALEPGQFAIVCDAQLTGLFQVMQQSDKGRLLTYRGSGVTPGNCAGDFDAANPCAPRARYRFADHALLAAFEPVVLFVEESRQRGQRLLYRRYLSLTRAGGHIHAGMRREEIIGGIEILRARLLDNTAMDVGIVAAAAPVPAAGPGPASVYLLGDDVTAWLRDNVSLHVVTEFSVAL